MTETLLERVAEDLYSVRLPLPFALRIVNCYLLRGAAGWTIVDTGIHTPAGEAVWQAVFNELAIQPHQLEQIVLTHVHPDHFGLAGWLQAWAAAAGQPVPVYASPREITQAQHVWYNPRSRADFGAWLRRNGMPADYARLVEQGMGDTGAMTLPHPPRLTPLAPGSMLRMGERHFRLIHAPGHSDGQLLFYDAADQLLLSGDHVLLKITPNIGLWEQTDANPLALFLTSLRELHTLPVRLALPGHKTRISDWRGRIEELLAHHAERLQHVLEALAGGAVTPYTISQRIFATERFTPHEWRFALAETLAHLDYLRVQGQVQQHAGAPPTFALATPTNGQP